MVSLARPSTSRKQRCAAVANVMCKFFNFSPQNKTRMFEGHDFPKSLSEEVFNQWLENGRLSPLGYHYLLIVWDEYESAYLPVYIERRNEIEPYKTKASRERLVAGYDLYSESRII
jgi:hypothetical protein